MALYTAVIYSRDLYSPPKAKTLEIASAHNWMNITYNLLYIVLLLKVIWYCDTASGQKDRWYYK